MILPHRIIRLTQIHLFPLEHQVNILTRIVPNQRTMFNIHSSQFSPQIPFMFNTNIFFPHASINKNTLLKYIIPNHLSPSPILILTLIFRTPKSSLFQGRKGKEDKDEDKTSTCARWYPQEESNLYLKLRRLLLYPLSYRGLNYHSSELPLLKFSVGSGNLPPVK